MAQGFTVDGEHFTMLEPDRMTFAEARAVEKVTGLSFTQIGGDDVSITTTQALLWVSMKRARPELKFADLDDVAPGSIEWDEAEPEADPTGADEAPSPADV